MKQGFGAAILARFVRARQKWGSSNLAGRSCTSQAVDAGSRALYNQPAWFPAFVSTIPRPATELSRMSRQHSVPYFVHKDEVQRLQPIGAHSDEDWLQRFIFTHYSAIPFNEIEPAFGPLIPVCRELPTKAGPVDMLERIFC